MGKGAVDRVQVRHKVHQVDLVAEVDTKRASRSATFSARPAPRGRALDLDGELRTIAVGEGGQFEMGLQLQLVGARSFVVPCPE